MKPGWKTTEFWLTLGVNAWALFGHALPPVAQAIVTAVTTAVYGLARTIAKAGDVAAPPRP